MKANGIDNIIFDLGGVVINLDIDHAFDHFSQLFGHDVRSHLLNDFHSHGFFLDYELGRIDDDQFRKSVSEMAGKDLDHVKLDAAWNAMLGNIPPERIEWIAELAKNHRVFILSNTNAIHVRRFNEVFEQASTNYSHPDNLFHKTYYSHLMNDRKPNASCFSYVLNDGGMIPERTLFYDDNTDNIQTANELGIRCVLVERNALRREQLPNGR